jgi:protein-disulfide isomerase
MFLKSLGAATAAVTLAAACGPQARSSITLVEGDAFLGPADAKVTVIEYGAPTCPGCKGWHDDNWARLKAAYIDTGKIKFVFREFPSHNPPVDAAIFSIARCAGTTDYFPVIDKAFERQMEIEIASRQGDVIPKLEALGQDFRLSKEQVQSCIKDPKNVQRVVDVQNEGFSRGVNSTPTFFLNEVLVIDPRYEALAPAIDTALGGAAPAAAPAEGASEAAPGQPAPAEPATTPGAQ